MADTARELAGDLAQAACQLLEFQKMTRRMPHLSGVSVNPSSLHRSKEDGGIEVLCYIVGEYYDRKAEKIVQLGHEGQIDALRVWAHRLGSDLNLGNARPDKYTARPGKTHSRLLETAATLPNGLRVRVYTSLDYDPDAPEYNGQRVGEPAIATA